METPIHVVAVVGAGDERDAEILDQAENVGRLLAERNVILLTGGKGGIMEAASRGAGQFNGKIVGLLPESTSDLANPFVQIPLATGLAEARNALIATACHAMIAVGGEFGTLSEIALTLKLGKPVIVLGGKWRNLPGVHAEPSPERAVHAALERLL